MTDAPTTGIDPASTRAGGSAPLAIRGQWWMQVGRAAREVVSPRTWFATGNLVLNLYIGVVTATILLVLLALTVGLAVILPAGVACLAATLLAGRAVGRFERWRFRSLLGIDLGSPTKLPRGLGWRARLAAAAKSKSTWRAIAHGVLTLPVGAVTFAATSVVWAVPLALVSLPATIWLQPGDDLRIGPGMALHGWAAAVPGFALGVVLLLGAPIAIRTLAAADAWRASALLGRSRADDLGERVQALAGSRSRVIDAAEAERRRIERDLHDGAQQRLVALAMELGRARQKFDTDPDEARALVDDAHGEAKQALAELRDLARGIHPAVLTDRGLDAALSSVAARSAVPVKLQVDVAERPAPAVEGIAYFVVSEALTNVAKHAAARRATVTIVRRGDRLLVEITDDGHGGADPAAGSGLAGLRARVEGIDGWLHVSSPVGGPTTIMAELPCGS